MINFFWGGGEDPEATKAIWGGKIMDYFDSGKVLTVG